MVDAKHGLLEEILRKSLERLGRKQLWQLVHALRALPTPSAASVREALRQLSIYISDDHAALLAHSYGDGITDLDRFFDDLLQCACSPRRLYAVQLVLRKLDPAKSGHIAAATLAREYDALRHPAVVSMTCSAAEVMAKFFADLGFGEASVDAEAEAAAQSIHLKPKENGGELAKSANGEESPFTASSPAPSLRHPVQPQQHHDHPNSITSEELMFYFAGISMTTPSDTEFELRCTRAFSLDRPRLNFEDEGRRMQGSRKLTRDSRALGVGQSHPLYTTTNAEYGDGCVKFSAKNMSKYGRSFKFTRSLPTRLGGATSMNM